MIKLYLFPVLDIFHKYLEKSEIKTTTPCILEAK